MKPRVRLKTKKSLRQTKASHKITDRGNQKKKKDNKKAFKKYNRL